MFRVKAYDIKNDIYIIQKKYLGLLWLTYAPAGAGPKTKMEELVNSLN